jgi:hypothetical protein
LADLKLGGVDFVAELKPAIKNPAKAFGGLELKVTRGYSKEMKNTTATVGGR